MVDDSTVCTHVDNVKRTALRVLNLEEEKFLAIEIAAEAEVQNDIDSVTIVQLQKHIDKYDKKIARQKFWQPLRETSKVIIYGVLGFVLGRL